ncbi:MAG: hypothetical protein A2297_07820 [Elusimicrobia bacterium RIFOXYB2_FULL_48_7]|nr:MAG: hypothetical protein A2297_07820 [Elusimicrobia bacterium RIFOXYB2_FULL_48_7]
MKKALMLVFALAVFAAPSAFTAEKKKAKAAAAEEESTVKTSLVTIAPVGLLYGALYANYETMIGEKSSIRPRLGYFKFESGDWKIQYTNIGVTYNMLGRHKLDGFCWGPRLDLYNVSYTFSNIFSSGDAAATNISFGLEIAGRWIFENDLVLEAGVAVGLYTTSADVTIAGQSAPSNSNLSFSPTLNLGYAF